MMQVTQCDLVVWQTSDDIEQPVLIKAYKGGQSISLMQNGETINILGVHLGEVIKALNIAKNLL